MKRGQFGTNPLFALIIVIVFVGIGAKVIGTVGDSDTVTTVTSVQQSLTAVLNGSAIDLNHTGIQTGNFNVTNASGAGETVGAGNYTITAAGTFTLAEDTTRWNNTNLNFSYTKSHQTGVLSNVTDQGNNALDNFSDLVPVIGTLLIAILLVSLVAGIGFRG